MNLTHGSWLKVPYFPCYSKSHWIKKIFRYNCIAVNLKSYGKRYIQKSKTKKQINKNHKILSVILAHSSFIILPLLWHTGDQAATAILTSASWQRS